MEEPATPAERTTSDAGVLPAGDAVLPFSLRRAAPSPAVASRVERHWCTRWRLPPGRVHRTEVLPHPCVNVVAYDGVLRVHGVPTGRFVRELAGSGTAIGTKFRPGAFAALTRLPMAALRDEARTPREAFGPDGDELERAVLARVPDPEAVWAAIEAWLAPRLPAPDARDRLVLAVTRDLLASPADARVADLARAHGVSERTLQRTFRERVGVGPKWVLARYRLHEATERLADDPDLPLARLAYELGYADQAHLSADFRAGVGVPPSAYARACRAGGLAMVEADAPSAA